MEEIFEQKCLAENFRVKFFWPNILLAENSLGRKLGGSPQGRPETRCRISQYLL